jgi:hypothetical protein
VSDASLPMKPPSRDGEAPTGAVRAGGVGCSVNRQVVIMTILIKESGWVAESPKIWDFLESHASSLKSPPAHRCQECT